MTVPGKRTEDSDQLTTVQWVFPTVSPSGTTVYFVYFGVLFYCWRFFVSVGEGSLKINLLGFRYFMKDGPEQSAGL